MQRKRGRGEKKVHYGIDQQVGLQFDVGCIGDGDPSIATDPADAVSKNAIIDDDPFGADDSIADHPTWNDGPAIVDGYGDSELPTLSKQQ